MRIILLFAFQLISTIVLCQNNIYKDLSESLGLCEVKNDVYKGQVTRGKKNGMGIFLSNKKNIIYIGDFYQNKMHGYGILIGSDNITNYSNCAIFVGNFRNGKKEGIGKCYSSDGQLIYKGQFENDSPIGPYSDVDDNLSDIFCKCILDGGDLYYGELDDNVASGYGLIIYADRSIWFSKFISGQKTGIGLYLQNDGEWETVNFNEGEPILISSSVVYTEMKNARKQLLGNAFKDLAINAIEVASSIQELNNTNSNISNAYPTSTYTSNSVATSTDSGSRNSGNYEIMYRNWESRAESNYNSLMSASSSPSTYTAQKRSFNEAQQEMRKIRTEAAQHGVTISQSKWETATVSVSGGEGLNVHKKGTHKK